MMYITRLASSPGSLHAAPVAGKGALSKESISAIELRDPLLVQETVTSHWDSAAKKLV